MIVKHRHDPHVMIEIARPDATDGQGTVRWSSWDNPRLFKSVDVELVTNESSQTIFTFFDPRFRIIDAFAGSLPTKQSVVRAWMGYGRDLGEPVFKGLLAQVERGDRDTHFVTFDMGYKMKLEKRAGYKNKKDDIAILKELAERNGLKFEGPDQPLNLEPRSTATQDEQTDWEWFAEICRDAGLVFYVRHDTIFAKLPAKVGTPKMTLRNRVDFQISPDFEFIFRTPENQDGTPKLVTHRRRGKAGKQIAGASDTSPGERTDLVLKRDVAKPSKSKLSRRAQAQKELEREHAFEGHIQTMMPQDGTRLDYRDTVAVANLGQLFSGDYICDEVGYHFDANGRFDMTAGLYRDIK
jgi:hypothetical protein